MGITNWEMNARFTDRENCLDQHADIRVKGKPLHQCTFRPHNYHFQPSSVLLSHPALKSLNSLLFYDDPCGIINEEFHYYHSNSSCPWMNEWVNIFSRLLFLPPSQTNAISIGDQCSRYSLWKFVCLFFFFFSAQSFFVCFTRHFAVRNTTGWNDELRVRNQSLGSISCLSG